MSIQKSQNAIVTLYIGEKYKSIANVTLPVMKKYASKIGADLIEITENKLGHGMEHYEKLQIYELFDSYERLAFFDIDILITSACPNIFSEVPESHFAAFDVSRLSRVHDNAIKLIQEKLGDIGWRDNYFNSGVMVASKLHKEAFNPYDGFLDTWSEISFREGDGTYLDQTFVNYNVKRLNFPFLDLGYKFNHTTAPNNSYLRFNSFIIHYPGKGHRRGSKIQQIQKDKMIIQNPFFYQIATKLSWLNILLDNL